MAKYTTAQLKKMKVTELKDLCKKEGLKRFYGKKADLIKYIQRELRKKSKKSKTRKKPKGGKKKPVKRVSKLKAGLSCDMSVSKCSKGSKYRKADIVALAEECGVELKDPKTGRVMSRAKLCKAIAKALKTGRKPVSKPVSHEKANCKKFRKTKDPKCDEQPGCRWEVGEGCIEDEEKEVDVVEVDVEVETVVVEDVVEDVEEDVEPAKEPSEYCFPNRTQEELFELGVKELRKLMVQGGIKKGRPRKKDQMIDYLCALGQQGRCDPEKGEMCDGDNVCDVAAKLCLPPDVAMRRGLEMMTYAGRKIVGTSAALKALRARLPSEDEVDVDEKEVDEVDVDEVDVEEVDVDEKEVDVDEPQWRLINEKWRRVGKEYLDVEDVEDVEEDIEPVDEELDCKEQEILCDDGDDEHCEEKCGSDFFCGSDNICSKGKRPTRIKPQEGDQVKSIEDILRKLEETGGAEDIGDLSAVQKEVLTCLGLLSSA